MSYNIIILTHEKTKVFQDGFGLNQKGELFLAIAKGGIKKNVACLIFIFTESGIKIIIDKVSIIKIYRVQFEDKVSQPLILDIHFPIISEIERLYKFISPEKIGALKYVGNTMNNVIQTIIKYVYSSVYKYVKKHTEMQISRKGINLKCRGYNKILTYTKEYNLANNKALVVGVLFIGLFYKK